MSSSSGDDASSAPCGQKACNDLIRRLKKRNGFLTTANRLRAGLEARTRDMTRIFDLQARVDQLEQENHDFQEIFEFMAPWVPIKTPAPGTWIQIPSQREPEPNDEGVATPDRDEHAAVPDRGEDIVAGEASASGAGKLTSAVEMVQLSSHDDDADNWDLNRTTSPMTNVYNRNKGKAPVYQSSDFNRPSQPRQPAQVYGRKSRSRKRQVGHISPQKSGNTQSESSARAKPRARLDHESASPNPEPESSSTRRPRANTVSSDTQTRPVLNVVDIRKSGFNSASLPGEIVLNVVDIRKSGFNSASLPGEIVERLVSQVKGWDDRRTGWERGDKSSSVKCVHTFSLRNQPQWRVEKGQLDTTHTCLSCEKSGRLCVALLSPGVVRVQPRRHHTESDEVALDGTDPRYWVKSKVKT
ncbi:MAG: hypothetical protein M1830_008607 [Pleopsidium flavum]|nr:MAG: hypothetical protein M1830_008607 [Pleopsidium flavum]